jgi:dihydroorotase
LKRLVELFTTGPAKVLGMERKLTLGAPGDITIFSTDKKWTYHVAETPSKSRNTPFDRREFTGGPVATIVAGKIIYKN